MGLQIRLHVCHLPPRQSDNEVPRYVLSLHESNFPETFSRFYIGIPLVILRHIPAKRWWVQSLLDMKRYSETGFIFMCAFRFRRLWCHPCRQVHAVKEGRYDVRYRCNNVRSLIRSTKGRNRSIADIRGCPSIRTHKFPITKSVGVMMRGS